MANAAPILSDEILRRFHERAPVYDRENRFFTEDFEDLRKTGYLKMAVPREFGGLGLTLAESCRETRRLAYWAPATALAVNMHIYWCGVAREVRTSGDSILRLDPGGRRKGEVFAAGHAETRQRPAGAPLDDQAPRRSTAATGSRAGSPSEASRPSGR